MSNEMKALVKAKAEPGLWMEHVPVPEPGPTDVLIKVRKSAICGTDVHIWKWDAFSASTVPVPMVVGHEFVGEIVDMGAAARKYRIGQRVSGEVTTASQPASPAVANRICAQPRSDRGWSVTPRNMRPPSGSPWRMRSIRVSLAAMVSEPS